MDKHKWWWPFCLFSRQYTQGDGRKGRKSVRWGWRHWPLDPDVEGLSMESSSNGSSLSYSASWGQTKPVFTDEMDTATCHVVLACVYQEVNFFLLINIFINNTLPRKCYLLIRQLDFIRLEMMPIKVVIESAFYPEVKDWMRRCWVPA